MSLVTKPSGRRSTDTAVGSQQVFIGFANFYRRFIQGFSRIAISLTAMLKTTGSSIALAFRVDDNEVVGGRGAGAESGGSIVDQIVGSIVAEYPEDEKGVYPSLLNMPTSHSLRTWLPNSSSTLGSTIMLSNWSMPMDSSDYPSHPQVLQDKLKSSANIRFASEGLTRLQTSKPIELLNGGPRDNLWLGLGDQECPRHDLR